jgi:hypothetical protein
MGNDPETRLIHLPGSLHLSRLQLFKESVVDPQVDVTAPESFLGHGWEVGDGTFVYFPHRRQLSLPFLQARVVEPDVVV